MNEPLILAFNLDTDSCRRLDMIGDALCIRVISVPRKQQSLPIGALLGLSVGTDPEAGKGFDDPMLVMCGLDEAQFSGFLQSLRQSGIPRIDLKAVLTPFNVTWSAVQLHDALREEHESMKNRRPGH